MIKSALTSATALLVAVLLLTPSTEPIIIQTANAQAVNEARFVGQFSGQVFLERDNAKIDVTLEVHSAGENSYEATLHLHESPESLGDNSGEDAIELEGTYEDYTLRLEGDFPLSFQFIFGRYTALDENNSYRGHLDSVIPFRPNS